MATAMAEAGAWSLADRLTTQVLLEEPDNGIARAVRAAARAHMGHVDDAVTDIERSQGVDAAWRDTLVLAGRAFVSAGAHDAAMRVADRLAARVVFRGMALPGTPRTNRDGLFDAFDALAPSPDLTLQWLETRFSTLRAHPELTAATTAITNALVDAGHVDEALAAWRRARLSRPDSALALNNHAWTIADQGDSLDEAEILARRAVALEREPNANTLDTLAWVLHLQGRHDNARAVLVRALAALYLTPPAARREARAVLVEHLGAIDAAIAAADAAHSTITREQDRRRRRR
jgi:tetratricopeptide (TPR) repeat protein